MNSELRHGNLFVEVVK